MNDETKTCMIVCTKKAIAVTLAVVCVLTGCGTEQENSNTGKQSAESGQSVETSAETKEEENPKEDGATEKTEIRREDYADCDGSGHGYTEIYYSDGSMEIEEY